VPEVTFDDLYFGCMYQGGAKVLHDLRWTVADIIPEAARRAVGAGKEKMELPDVDDVLRELPMAAHPAVKRFGSFYHEWLEHPTMGEFWRQYSPNSGYGGITAPALNISGWYDIFVPSTLNNYMEMKKRGGSEIARGNQRLIMGPWSHMNFTGVFPEMSYGDNASAKAIDLTQIKIDWYDRWLKGIPKADEPPVRIFVMGINEWRYEQDWPLPDTEYCPWYLHSKGAANTLGGDGWLSGEKPEKTGSEKADSYIFDPMDPVPTIGGQVILPGENAIGPRDQSEAEKHGDVLVYSTPVLEKAVEVTGNIRLKLFASSDALDTDFTAKLVDVFPEGRAMILTEGILRARYHESFEMPKLLVPGEIYEFTVEMGATSNVFLPGHCLRLEVSSSNFPKFNRNSNTGGNIAEESTGQYMPARNTV
jgi:putative CocE/NonD family hydrolase